MLEELLVYLLAGVPRIVATVITSVSLVMTLIYYWRVAR